MMSDVKAVAVYCISHHIYTPVPLNPRRRCTSKVKVGNRASGNRQAFVIHACVSPLPLRDSAGVSPDFPHCVGWFSPTSLYREDLSFEFLIQALYSTTTNICPPEQVSVWLEIYLVMRRNSNKKSRSVPALIPLVLSYQTDSIAIPITP